MSTHDPLQQFTKWFEQACDQEPSDPDAASLASVDANGAPSIRIVLVRAYDANGFVFYTNLNSRKAMAFAQNARAALCFHWKSTARQVRIEGAVTLVDDEAADAYFAGRPRESQIGAWASRQSAPLGQRADLIAAVDDFAARFADQTVPRPDFWSGYRLRPQIMEFWDKRPARLHDRQYYIRRETGWERTLLYP